MNNLHVELGLLISQIRSGPVFDGKNGKEYHPMLSVGLVESIHSKLSQQSVQSDAQQSGSSRCDDRIYCDKCGEYHL